MKDNWGIKSIKIRVKGKEEKIGGGGDKKKEKKFDSIQTK